FKIANIQNSEDYIEDFLVDEFYSESDSNLGSLSDPSITSLLPKLYLEDYSNLVSITDSLTTSLLEAVDNSVSENSDFDNESEDKCESDCIECEFTLNAAYQKCINLVYINKLTETHNHDLKNSKLVQQSSLSAHKIPSNIKEEICFYVQECQLEATVLKRILRN
ncbi:16757_t:CDS:2, partial [Racocetra fulgida]